MKQSPRVTIAVVGLMFALLALVLRAEQPAKKAEAVKPPWQRQLGFLDGLKAAQQENKLAELQEAGTFEEALKVAAELAKLRAKVQGNDHWQAVDARFTVEAIRRVLKANKEEQKSYSRSFAIERQAHEKMDKDQHGEAQRLWEQFLAIRRRVLGDEHPETAVCYNNLASVLDNLNKYREAEALYRKALAIHRQALGEEHPDTSNSYNNLASNLDEQGKHREAEPVYRKALRIRLKVLGEYHLDTATTYNNLGFNLHEQGQYSQAEAEHHKALAIRRKLLGENHLETAASYNGLAVAQNAQAKHAEAEKNAQKALAIHRKLLGDNHPETARTYNTIAHNLEAQGKHTQAEIYYRKALTIRRNVLGENDLDTASSYNNVATNKILQGKYTEGDENLHKALSIRLAVLGEDHPDTALTYNNVGFNLDAQGRFQGAEKNYRRALAIYLRILGEEHPDTARTYSNIALNLNFQGRYGEADEIARKALTLRRRAFGETHPDTASSYNNIAGNFAEQGNYPEAEKYFRKALDAFVVVLGEHHPMTATSYNNVAGILNIQGKHQEAELILHKALAIYQEVYPTPHPRTATAYRGLAATLDAQGRHQEAEDYYRKTLAICREVLGENHPHTALTLYQIAKSLHLQGKYPEAEEYFGKALAIRRQVLGEDHPHTSESYSAKALALYAQGKFQEAETIGGRAAESFSKARLRLAATGLDRAAKTSEKSPLLPLAAVLVRNGKPDDAWQRFEESLARGTWDDLTARLRRPQAERDKQTRLIARIDRLNEFIEKASVVQPTPEQSKRREEWLAQLRQAYDELAAFTQQLEKTYGPVAGQVYSRAQIQKSLSQDTALLAWLDLPAQPRAKDVNGEHWAVLLRSTGDPIWVKMSGTGEKGAWTDADTQWPTLLRKALQSSRGRWEPLAERLRRQRLKPLAPYLKDVRRLIVLPSTELAGVPIEVIAAGYTIGYAHSGTMYAHLRQQPPLESKGLFALADPVFQTTVAEKPPSLPSHGVLLQQVLPGSNAFRAGLRANDVLLRYGDTELKSPTDFKPLPEANDPEKKVPVIVWREGEERNREVLVIPGKLGVVIAREPAPQALAEQRRQKRELALSRGDGDWKELPGTRIEAAALQRLFGATARLLQQSEAGEQQLNQLAASGELGKFRYIHLATHGEVNNIFPLRSAVILSRDQLPTEKQRSELLLPGQPIPDGRLEADEALRRWNLHCDLVTLSACQTALGKYERGEGFVGFAQALILCGTRSVCLSLWKVDDVATALLMERFYENLLGKREGLNRPMAKAAALAEAKTWLRTLPRAQAEKRAAKLSDGLDRSKRPALPPLPGTTPAAPAAAVKSDHPFAHPYYWAAFILIGDPG